MPKTLYRYILTEVARVTAVSALALVMVMAFGAAIKPLTEGMLGADSLFKFMLFMAPSMLQYALPFAAAMGSTLVYLRMSQDNEVLACQASGLSSFRVVAPAAVLGAVLLALLLGLSGAVAPAFYRKAMQTARGDVVSAMVRKLSGGQAFTDEASGIVLYANQAEVMDAPGQAQGTLEAEMAVKLTGVVVGQMNKKTGKMEGDLTASGAVGVIYRDTVTGDAMVAMRLENPDIAESAAKPADKGSKGSDAAHFVRAKAIDRLWFELPNPVKDKVEFSSLGQLLRMLREPARFDAVRRRIDALSKAVAMEKFRGQIEEEAVSGVSFKGPLGSEIYTLRAPRCAVAAAGVMKLAGQGRAKVTVEHRVGATVLRHFEAESGELGCEIDRETGEPVAELKLTGVRISDPRQPGVVSARPEHVFDALASRVPILAGTSGLGAKEWIAQTADAAARNPAGDLAQARAGLALECELLRNKVVAQFHIRAASAIACLLLALLGALMSLWRRGSLPLVVYFWCFLVAIASILLINVGGNMAKKGGGGLTLAWAPVVFQAVMAVWILRRLRKPGI